MALKEFRQLGIAFSVDGFDIPRFAVRRRLDAPGQFDLLIEDPIAGPFPLDERFRLEIRVLGQGCSRVIDLMDVKQEILSRLQANGLEISADALRPVEGQKKEDQASRAKEILYRACIPCLEEAARDETGCIQSGLILYVPRLLQARIRLRRAGFRQSLEVTSALQDPETGLWIELLERPCDRKD
jgi:hypothetical protein